MSPVDEIAPPAGSARRRSDGTMTSGERNPQDTLKSLLRGKYAGIAFNAHFMADGAIIYRQACGLDCEGIVSKR